RTPVAAVSLADHGPADAPDPGSSDEQATPGSLTPSQRRMWFAQAVDPSSTTYNLAAQIRVRGGVGLDEVRSALAAVVADQPALRSAFSVDDGDIVSTVHPDVVPRIDVVDRRSVDGVESRIAAARSRIVELARAPFDLSRPPLVRFTCDVIDHYDLVFGVVIHHIIADQWSFGVLLDAVGVAVAQQRAPRSDGDGVDLADGQVGGSVSPWIERVGSDEIERQMDYWRSRLSGLSSLELPVAATSHRERPAFEANDGVLLVSLDDGLRSRIDAYAAARGATGFMVYASTLAVLLSEVAGSDDIPIGMPIANRHHLDTERMITSLVNTLVLRIDTSGRSGFDELLAHVRDRSLEAFDHQDVPFDRIVGELAPPRAGARSPFFQVFLNVHNAPIALPSLSGAHFDILPVEHRAVDFDLSLTIDPELTGVLRVEFDPRQVEGDSAAAWSSRFIEMLHRVVSPAGPPPIADLRSTGAVSTVAAGDRTELDDTPSAGDTASVPVGRGGARADLDERRRELEATLVRIWTDVLDVDHVGLDDDFFDLGGHSLLAVRMFSEIHESTGRRPPIGLLFRAPTIAGLAALLDEEGWASEWTSMVRVSDDDATGVPVFVITPYLISALSFHGLARELGGRVVYALEPHAVAAESDGHASISQVAARYVSEMKTVQPVGPYDVVGHCAGAWEALEVVGHLEDQGDVVGSLTVVDIAPPGVEPPRPSPIRYVISRLRLYTRSGASRLLHAAWWRARMLLLGWSARAGSGDDDTSRRAALREAHRRYGGRQVRSDIHLIRSEEWSGLPDKDWHLRWADRSSGSLTVDTVPGSHARLLQAESLDDFAEALRRHLDA
ncbi:MAG: condensation domain-containing protein, partial [Actinomycetota bacterium]